MPRNRDTLEGGSNRVLAFVLVVGVLAAGAAGLVAAQQADQFEPNDNVAEATQLDGGTYDGLSIDSSADVDVYTIDVSEGDEISVDLEFSHADGDIDVQLFDPSQTEAERSVSISDNEHISHDAQTSGTYYVVVYGYLGATNTYTMTVDPGSGLLGGNLPLIIAGGALVVVGYFVFVKE